MLILAVVAIRAVSNDGIISHAKNARAEYEKAQAEEKAMLESYLDKIVEIPIEETQKDTMLSKEMNSVTFDKYGNKIVVPAGFKILVDNTTDYTPETIDVTKGIIIQDSNGNEFVWIPVGTIYTNEEKTASKTITLGRYSNFTATDGVYTPATTDPSVAVDTNYTEGLKDSTTANAHAKDIVAFKTSAETNHGYYLGRYEAGVSGYDANNITTSNSNSEENWTGYVAAEGKELQLVCKSNQQVWNYVTQKKASELCRSMYINKPFESDLINSYAWDTAIVFIQTFGANGDNGKETDSSTYAAKNKSNGLKQTGANQKDGVPDKYRNIYDMSGNAVEWSTETCSGSILPCTNRGGYYLTRGGALNYTSSRGYGSTTIGRSFISFRPLLYV